jgi:EAL and modified HD-GYP domain-containing signal transduction protein
VNHTRDFLVRELYELFEPKSVVIELLETVKPDAEVVAACKRLVGRGYTLALDDFVHAPEYKPLLELAKIVKVDVLNQSEQDLARVVAQLKPYDVRLLAERVETSEVRDTCKRLGFTLFQGYYFSRPQIVSHRELSVDQTTMLRLMNLLDDHGAGDAQIEEAFRSDPSLSYKLLRIANSAAFAGREVQSIGYALRLVGRGVLHRWLTLLLVSSVASRNGIAHELVQSALMRARLCELSGQASGRRADMGPLFLVGLFSLLDALLRMPMAGILDRMNIDLAVRDALLTRSGPYAAVLQLVEAQERGDWLAVGDAAKAAGVPLSELPVMYRDALGWAAERMGAMG